MATITWEDFRKDVQARFLLPLRQQYFKIDFVPVNLTPQELTSISNHITAGVVEAVRNAVKADLSALRVSGPEPPKLFSIVFGHPGFGFGLDLYPDRFVLGKQDCQLEELIMTLPLYEGITDQLFSSSSKYSLQGTDFYRRAYRLTNHFSHNLTLGTRLTDESEFPRNIDLMPYFVSMGPAESSVLTAMQPEEILRTDTTLSLRPFPVGNAMYGLPFQAPWNVTRRDIYFTFEVRLAEGEVGSGIEAEDFQDFESSLRDSYREFVLKRIFPQVFHDVHVYPKPGG